MRRRLLLAGKTAVSVLLLWLLFATYDISDAVARIGRIVPGLLAAAVIAELASVVIATWRWTLILRAMNIRVPYFSALPIFWIGLFFNQVLPSNLGGDVVRVWRVFKRGSDPVYAFGSVMLDRVVAVIGMVVLVAACLPFVSSMTDDPLLIRTLAGIIAVTAAGLAVLLVIDRLVPLTRHLLPDEMVGRLVRLSHDIRRFLLGPSQSVPTVALSVINHLVIVAMVYALAMGLHIDIGLVDCLVLAPPVLLFSLMPISYAGWGVREGAMVAAFGLVGVPPAESLALSVAFGLILVATALPGGIIWFTTGNVRQS